MDIEIEIATRIDDFCYINKLQNYVIGVPKTIANSELTILMNNPIVDDHFDQFIADLAKVYKLNKITVK